MIVDTNILALAIVGLIGYAILTYVDEGKSMITWSDVGKILLIFAVVEGLMYVVAPVPVTDCTKPTVMPFRLPFGGGGVDANDAFGGSLS